MGEVTEHNAGDRVKIPVQTHSNGCVFCVPILNLYQVRRLLLMATVFLAGSLPIRVLSAEARVRLDNLMNLGVHFVLGDAPGADTLLQKYLWSKRYPNVTVYVVGDRVRNNVGGWQVANVPPDPNASQRDYYVAKDIAMTEVSDVGLMLWDRVSRGTRNNILRMIGQGKKVVVITSLGAYLVTTEQDLVLI